MERPRLKPRILLVEDNMERIETFRAWLAETEFTAIEASSGGRALGILRKGMTEGIAGLCLDHDLDNQPMTDADLLLSGSSLIKAIAVSLPRSVPILIHSMNPNKSHDMGRRLVAAGFSVTRVRMEILTAQRFDAWLQEVRDNCDE